MPKIIAVCGDSGSGKSTMAKTLSDYLDNSIILECDRYHKWERNNENWKKFSHLNPESNYISLLNSDVSSLSLGKTIYRRDYDHSTGKFTTDEKITPLDTVVICGLHTFYVSEDLCDFKIFMKTDDDLRVQWKISRDIRDRGHTLAKVKKQIADRRSDYLSFILPKAEDADIIINFCNELDISYIDSVKGIGNFLRLFISESYNVFDIIEEFKSNEVKAEFVESSKKGFNELVIRNYKPLDGHYYYDYIMICVLSMLRLKCLI